ncbi:hypothetical protein [Bathymodiolus platifrons methanotrophic gill symbiont]|nr:hypothetical protein [Bathymodiolus platifrons methanotrophic gill symbiont]
MKFDKYSLKARIIPAFFSIIIPIMIFNNFYISEELYKFMDNVLFAKFVSNISMFLICLYYLSEAGRFISKNIFEKIYFKDEMYMPTTNYLLFQNTKYSSSFKKRIHNKVLSDFGIKLLSSKKEILDENEARRKIVETMALIRKKLRKNAFLVQHNIEYGAMRNTIGGSVLGALFSIFNIIFFKFYFESNLAVYISISTLIIYLLFIIFSKVIVNFYGNNYAKIIYREY